MVLKRMNPDDTGVGDAQEAGPTPVRSRRRLRDRSARNVDTQPVSGPQDDQVGQDVSPPRRTSLAKIRERRRAVVSDSISTPPPNEDEHALQTYAQLSADQNEELQQPNENAYLDQAEQAEQAEQTEQTEQAEGQEGESQPLPEESRVSKQPNKKGKGKTRGKSSTDQASPTKEPGSEVCNFLPLHSVNSFEGATTTKRVILCENTQM